MNTLNIYIYIYIYIYIFIFKYILSLNYIYFYSKPSTVAPEEVEKLPTEYKVLLYGFKIIKKIKHAIHWLDLETLS